MDESASKILESFVQENVDLERLEALLRQFNIFEAIGAVRQELRHSDFLSYLLDPRQTHGLQGRFAKKFLQKAITSSPSESLPVTVIDLDTWDLDQMEVTREWNNIDILLRDEANRLAVAIENKIDSAEHSDQLPRYRETLNRLFPGWRSFGIYLTPDGEQPSEQFFLPIDYGWLSNALDEIAEGQTPKLQSDIETTLRHYTQMLRRHIVSQSDVGELCIRIYQKHKQAIDLIIEHIPDRRATIRSFLEDLIRGVPNLILDDCSKSYIRFIPKEWDLASLRVAEGWTSTKRILLFEFQNYRDSLRLKLLIGPGPKELREAIFRTALKGKPLFKPASKAPSTKWNEIFSRDFISSKVYTDGSDDQLKEEIRKHWTKFITDELNELTNALQDEPWFSPMG